MYLMREKQVPLWQDTCLVQVWGAEPGDRVEGRYMVHVRVGRLVIWERGWSTSSGAIRWWASLCEALEGGWCDLGRLQTGDRHPWQPRGEWRRVRQC